MGIKNLTPHAVVVRNDQGDALVTIPSTGEMARVTETNETIEPVVIDGIEVSVLRKEFTGEVTGLPTTPEEGVTYIVPLLTAIAAKAAGRSTQDLLVPGTPTRDENGTVNGCTSLARLV